MIRGIVNLDRRERRLAGFTRGSRGIKVRLAQQLGVTIWCVDSVIRKRSWKNIQARKL